MAFHSDLRAIARALGGEVVGRQVVAPGPGHSPRDRSLSVTISAAAPEGFLAFSHAGDDFAECRDHVKARLGIDRRQQENRPQTPPRRPTQPPRDDDRDPRALMFAKQIVSEMRPILGTPGETYLRDIRKIDTDVLERTDAIGWLPAVYFNEPGHALHGRKLGCIVGVMTDPITAMPTGAISRTYIREGRKVCPAKTLGSPAGIVRLSLDEGKSRLNRDASMRPTRAWRVMVASTGEVPVETKLAEDNGRKAHAGQLVRMIDVPATERACGAFDSATDGDSRALADKFKLAASTHYGTAGPEFVRRLIVDGVDGDAIRELINGFAKANVPPGSDGQIERVAGRFGIIAAAGEMAIEFGLTGWDKGAATAAAAWAFSQWIEAQGGGAIEERQAIAQVRQIIEQYGDSRFQSLADSDGRPVNDRLGWRQNTADGPEWYATPENFKTQICAGLNPQKVAKSLSERGMLRKQKGPGYQCSIRIGADKLKVYALKNILEEGQET